MGSKAQATFLQRAASAVKRIPDGTWYVPDVGYNDIVTLYGRPVEIDNALGNRIIELRQGDDRETLTLPPLFEAETYLK